MSLQDLTGQRFGRLTCIRDAGRNEHGEILWLCECDCGNQHVARGAALRYGSVKSCGCLQRDRTSEASKTHGLCFDPNGKLTRLYRIWAHMRRRCLDETENNKDYRYYGGRGVRVCEAWNDYAAFHGWAMAAGYRDNLTIDRIDNNGNYEPGNCRWATRKEQSANSRHNYVITYSGQTKRLTEWSKFLRINHNTLWKRLYKGWSVQRAFTQSVRRRIQTCVL